MVSTCNNTIGDVSANMVAAWSSKRIQKQNAVMASLTTVYSQSKPRSRCRRPSTKNSQLEPEHDNIFYPHWSEPSAPGMVRQDDVFPTLGTWLPQRVEDALVRRNGTVFLDALYEQVASCSQFKLFPLGRFALKGKGENRRSLYEVQWTERLSQKCSSHGGDV